MSGKFGVFNPFRKWKKGDPLGDTHITIVVNELNAEDDGRIRMTPKLATDSEIDYEIDQMKRDLESVRKEAKSVLKTQRDKIRASFDK